MDEQPAPTRCLIKSVTIDRPAADVHAFLAEVTNWPRWAIVNILSVGPSPHPGWWSIETPQGAAEIRLRADAATGTVDHDFRDPDDPEDVAAVPARVVANGRGAHVSLTIFQPPGMEDADFDEAMAPVDRELATLRELLERG
jgi:hypothetical protein